MSGMSAIEGREFKIGDGVPRAHGQKQVFPDGPIGDRLPGGSSSYKIGTEGPNARIESDGCLPVYP